LFGKMSGRAGQSTGCFTAMECCPLRSRLVFNRLKDFLPSEIDIVIPLSQKILQAIKSLRDLMQQLIKHPG
jgi:predicted component of type VI protein secretion system